MGMTERQHALTRTSQPTTTVSAQHRPWRNDKQVNAAPQVAAVRRIRADSAPARCDH